VSTDFRKYKPEAVSFGALTVKCGLYIRLLCEGAKPVIAAVSRHNCVGYRREAGSKAPLNPYEDIVIICDVCHIHYIKAPTPYAYNETFLNTFYHKLISEANNEKNM
jgi:hypothetical protein